MAYWYRHIQCYLWGAGIQLNTRCTIQQFPEKKRVQEFTSIDQNILVQNKSINSSCEWTFCEIYVHSIQ